MSDLKETLYKLDRRRLIRAEVSFTSRLNTGAEDDESEIHSRNR